MHTFRYKSGIFTNIHAQTAIACYQVRRNFSETKYASQQPEITALPCTHSHSLAVPPKCFIVVTVFAVSLLLLTSTPRRLTVTVVSWAAE